ncbi:transposase [Streptomyces lavendulae]|uniref:transposase n=1 Tax=Streptomyces lavendulae TaxID=1914 RepID=UPI0036CD67D4
MRSSRCPWSLRQSTGYRLCAAVPARPVGPAAAEAVRSRIDFEYAMAMELDDPGFHHSVPADFRDRLGDGREGPADGR